MSVAKKIVETEYYKTISKMYTDRRRVYHGLGHIAYQFSLIDEFLPLIPEDDKDAALDFLFNASLFHDCYYEYGVKHSFNEKVSAEYAMHYLSNINANLANDVYFTILASAFYNDKNKQVEILSKCKSKKLALLFLDIDLHSMQSSKHENMIKEEALNYGITENDYRIGRKAFIASMQNRINEDSLSGFFHIPYFCLYSYFDSKKVKKTFGC